jgi:hypothetical protein
LVLKDVLHWGDAHEDAKKITPMKHKFNISQHENSRVDQGEVEIIDIGLLMIALA